MKRSLLVTCCWAVTIWPCAPLPAADELALSPRQGVLLLNNGEVIAGTITPAGDRFDVHLTDGELHLKRTEVVDLFPDMMACYRFKCAGIEAENVKDHLDLAEWCLKNNLTEPADQQLGEARAVDPKHPRIRLIEARLQLAEENAKRPATETARGKSPADAPAQLDRMVRNLPAGSVETFTNTVQPMLLNYCSRAGCHGAQSTNSLRLERVSSRLAGRHPTQRNLQAALALVDIASPEESKLLKAPIRAHGSLKTPIFTDREQSQYKQLVQWVYTVSSTNVQTPPPSISERGAPLLQTLPRADETGQRDDAPGEPAPAADKPAAEAGAEAPRRGTATRGTRLHGQSPSRSQQAEATDNFTPRDPFDPEIFNRRFFGR